MQLYRHRFKAMGSPCEIQLYAGSLDVADRVANTAIADVRQLEARYSRYRDDSYLSTINRVASTGGEIRVDDETAALLDYAATCYRESDGLFDITSGVLRRAWRFDRGQLPNQDQIEALLASVGWDKLRWTRPVLAFPTPGLELDFGGVVKEYAADRAAALCEQGGLHHGIVNLGGDIRVVGPHPDGSPWRIGVRDPRRLGALVQMLSLRAGGLASSGDYERCIVVDGERYGHILNPRTGWPVKHLASVSVVADLCLVAGSASTIAMLKEKAGPQWLEQMGVAHLWMDVRGAVGGPLVTPSEAAGEDTCAGSAAICIGPAA